MPARVPAASPSTLLQFLNARRGQNRAEARAKAGKLPHGYISPRNRQETERKREVEYYTSFFGGPGWRSLLRRAIERGFRMRKKTSPMSQKRKQIARMFDAINYGYASRLANKDGNLLSEVERVLDEGPCDDGWLAAHEPLGGVLCLGALVGQEAAKLAMR